MHHILAADIGGTNSRFAAFEADTDGSLKMGRSQWLSTSKAGSFDDLLAQLTATDFELLPEKADMVVIAVAGPVEKGVYSRPPNIDWEIDVGDGAKGLGGTPCELINDFAAQAYACRSPLNAKLRQVIPAGVDPDALLVVVGAGTGLGHAALVKDRCQNWLALPSEGGHATFAFETETEMDYMRFLRQQTRADRIEAETVVSGPGLARLHHYLTGDKLEPEQVAGRLGEDGPTVQWMARFYGRVCRNYALQLLPYGGVYIAGGVAAKLPQLVMHPEFKTAFRASATMARELEKMPVFLNTDEESGLWGAAFYGRQRLNNG